MTIIDSDIHVRWYFCIVLIYVVTHITCFVIFIHVKICKISYASNGGAGEPTCLVVWSASSLLSPIYLYFEIFPHMVSSLHAVNLVGNPARHVNTQPQGKFRLKKQRTTNANWIAQIILLFGLSRHYLRVSVRI